MRLWPLSEGRLAQAHWDSHPQISMDAIRAANDRMDELDHESIPYAREHPDEARGWLEAYIVRVRAPHPERLPPTSPLKRNR